MTQTAETAKEQAAGVGHSAAGAGQHVAATAKDEASNVVQEAASQARDVVGTAREELAKQAAEQQQRVASGLRSLAGELGSMADNSQDPGYASDLARQASSRANDVAGWLEDRDGSGLLDDVKSFARRRPGAFIALALGAGVMAGRLTRGLKDESSSGSSGSTPAPYADTSDGYPVADGYNPSYETAPVYPATSATPVEDDLFIVSPAVGENTGQEGRRP